MRNLITALLLTLSLTAAAFAQGPDAKAKGEEIMKKARAAVGDDKKLKEFTGLTANGTSRQTFGDFQMENELQIDLLAPDKIMTTFNSQRGTRIQTLNGDQLWFDNIPGMGGGGPGGGPGGGGGMRIMMGGPGGDPNSPIAKFMQAEQRRSLSLVMLGLLLTAPPSAQIEYSFAGEAPGPEGVKLNAIIAKSALGFNAVLYLNQENNHLVGVKYKAKQMRGNFRRGPGGPGGPGGGQGNGQGGGQGGGRREGQGNGQPGQRPELSPEDRERIQKEMAERFEKAPEVEYSWAFSEYKNAGGLNLPHRLTKSEGGTPNEEWEISKYKINPKLAPDKFVKKEKEKASTN
jgi:hypothetical protein